MRFRFSSALPDYLRDAEEVVRAFAPYVVVAEDAEDILMLSANLAEGGTFSYDIHSKLGDLHGEEPFLGDLLTQKRLSKRFFKNLLYQYISTASGVTLPYGSLTGVRPTKLFYELTLAGEDAFRVFQTVFRVAENKTELVRETVLAQCGVYDHQNKDIDLFINIPFCPTRCAYCSFLSAEYPKIKKQIPAYIAAVKQELAEFLAYLKTSGRALRAVYVGGGTPTALTAEELAQILDGVPCPKREYTVEAGRPDTILAQHLDVLARAGVGRISVNPQTFNDEVLQNIGRKHTTEDTIRAYMLAKSYGFCINMDFIAGLEGESVSSFLAGIARAIDLKPDNITVHTLALKRGADLILAGAEKSEFGVVSEMVDGARNLLSTAGYRPYYMYRQKNMADNLENVGYALPGTEAAYNVDIMEETTDIYAIGAGAMSKRILGAENRLERLANPKGLNEYLARIDFSIAKKKEFFL